MSFKYCSDTPKTIPGIETLLLLDPQRVSFSRLSWHPKTENSVDEIEIRKVKLKSCVNKKTINKFHYQKQQNTVQPNTYININYRTYAHIGI